jgi:DNA topoisomerase VI subunit B
MAKAVPKLERATFGTSRLMEYFTEQQLEMQMGCVPERWPLALTKELIDNSLDACETESIPPYITVSLDGKSISVADNGPGLSEETLSRSLNYAITVSDKAHYVSPTRGQLGNALKCVWAAPFVYNGECAQVDVQTPSYAYGVRVAVDAIAQEPELKLVVIDKPFVKTGTIVKAEWLRKARLNEPLNADSYKPDDAEEEEAEGGVGNDGEGLSLSDRVLRLLQDYTVFNPHADFRLIRDGEIVMETKSIAVEWHKWLPTFPTSPHWYGVEELGRLIGAYIITERDQKDKKTVRKFVSEFSGLSSSAKQRAVTDAAGLSGLYLYNLVKGNAVDMDAVGRLLNAMCAESKPVKADKLGIIGEEALTRRLVEVDGVVESSIRYKKTVSDNPVRPTITEAAFGLRNNGTRQVRFGLNFTPTLKIPLATLSEWLQYDAMLEASDRACLTVHVSRPRFGFASRAKSTLTTGGAR